MQVLIQVLTDVGVVLIVIGAIAIFVVKVFRPRAL